MLFEDFFDLNLYVREQGSLTQQRFHLDHLKTLDEGQYLGLDALYMEHLLPRDDLTFFQAQLQKKRYGQLHLFHEVSGAHDLLNIE